MSLSFDKNIACRLLGDALPRFVVHQLQRRIHPLFGEDVQKWGLLQLDGQRLFQRVVKDRVAGWRGRIAQRTESLLPLDKKSRS